MENEVRRTAKYKPGDKVRIRYDLNYDTDPVLGIMPKMIGLAGKVVTIRRIGWSPKVGEIYTLEEEEGTWYWWSNKCFVGLKPTISLLDLIGGNINEI